MSGKSRSVSAISTTKKTSLLDTQPVSEHGMKLLADLFRRMYEPAGNGQIQLKKEWRGNE